MKILVTGVERPVPEIVTRLEGQHEVKTLATLPQDPSELPPLVSGCDAVVHGGAYVPGLDERTALDLATRRTYDLLGAAAQARVAHVVILSTLDSLRHHPENYRVTEEWPTRPPVELRGLCLYLAEQVCREFARMHLFRATCVRLGKVVLEEEVMGEEVDLSWIDARDAAGLVDGVLRHPHEGHYGHWRVVHAVARFPNPRFPVFWSRRSVRFRLEHTFGFEWKETE